MFLKIAVINESAIFVEILLEIKEFLIYKLVILKRLT